MQKGYIGMACLFHVSEMFSIWYCEGKKMNVCVCEMRGEGDKQQRKRKQDVITCSGMC